MKVCSDATWQPIKLETDEDVIRLSSMLKLLRPNRWKERKEVYFWRDEECFQGDDICATFDMIHEVIESWWWFLCVWSAVWSGVCWPSVDSASGWRWSFQQGEIKSLVLFGHFILWNNQDFHNKGETSLNVNQDSLEALGVQRQVQVFELDMEPQSSCKHNKMKLCYSCYPPYESSKVLLISAIMIPSCSQSCRGQFKAFINYSFCVCHI